MSHKLHSPKDVEDDFRRSESHFVTRKDLERLERLIRMTQAELAAGLKSLQTQVGKIATEQSARFDAAQAKIAELEALIAAGGAITTEVTEAFDAVKAAMQTLDDVIPDAPPA